MKATFMWICEHSSIYKNLAQKLTPSFFTVHSLRAIKTKNNENKREDRRRYR